MVYTVTFNPAVDYTVCLNELSLGNVNRTDTEKLNFGGKGVNVSAVLHNLGVDNIALGFTAGFTGVFFENSLNEIGVTTDFVHLKKGITRINVKLKMDKETEINASGPKIENADIEALFAKLENLKSNDFLVLAGSIPKSLPTDIYEKILDRLDGKNINYIIDAEKDLLVNTLKFGPFLIKPNHKELGQIFDKVYTSADEIIEAAKQLQKMGAKNVLVSMAGDGAVLVSQFGDVYKQNAARGDVRNSVGAGDSMIAGFIAGFLETKDYIYALKMGSAAGSATAFSDKLGTKDEIISLMSKM